MTGWDNGGMAVVVMFGFFCQQGVMFLNKRLHSDHTVKFECSKVTLV